MENLKIGNRMNITVEDWRVGEVTQQVSRRKKKSKNIEETGRIKMK
jgi:hypothetical protein